MLQGYNEYHSKLSFREVYGCYDLVCGYKLSLAHMLNDLRVAYDAIGFCSCFRVIAPSPKKTNKSIPYHLIV
jgi:thiamine transporter ThiT